MTARSTRTKVAAPFDPAKLKRESAGRYVTGDGRFSVEESSGGWMVVDDEQVDELGLPLVRGPFASLVAARAAMEAARLDPAPVSGLAARIAALPKRPAKAAAAQPLAVAGPPPIIVREYRAGDGDALRSLWRAVGFRSLGDDDESLRTFTQRNPGTLLVAVQGGSVVGSAMGAWDGRRGWIYHVAALPEQRRTGLATRLVRQVEERLGSLGCRKVNVIVRDDNEAGAAFWEELGYTAAPARQMGRELSS
jgi:GNAT superfamily N-acetyltransferase